MRFVHLLKTGKRIFCCLLVFVLIAGQDTSLAYAEDTEGFGDITTYAVGDTIEIDGIKYRISGGYAEVANGQNVDLSGRVVIRSEVSDGSTVYPVVVD